LGEGTFSEVLKAESVKTKQKVAIKCMKSHFDSIEKVQNLREIKALQRLSPHNHIIQLIEVLYDEPTGRLALVFEIMEMNLYEAIKGRQSYLPEARVKHYIYQLMKAIEHMHRNGIFHRDIKP
jgi:renal tumor antigen